MRYRVAVFSFIALLAVGFGGGCKQEAAGRATAPPAEVPVSVSEPAAPEPPDYYRTVTGGRGLSRHALGRAIDLNRPENPMVCGAEKLVHPDEPPYVPKSYRPGEDPYSIPGDSIVVHAFKRRGWRWGGDFTTCVDHQHFDKR